MTEPGTNSNGIRRTGRSTWRYRTLHSRLASGPHEERFTFRGFAGSTTFNRFARFTTGNPMNLGLLRFHNPSTGRFSSRFPLSLIMDVMLTTITGRLGNDQIRSPRHAPHAALTVRSHALARHLPARSAPSHTRPPCT